MKTKMIRSVVTLLSLITLHFSSIAEEAESSVEDALIIPHQAGACNADRQTPIQINNQDHHDYVCGIETIYENDDRKNYYSTTDVEKKAMQATAIRVGRHNVDIKNLDSSGKIVPKYQDSRLCPCEEQFHQEKILGDCSAFKIDGYKDLLATAGHCIISKEVCVTRDLYVFRHHRYDPQQTFEPGIDPSDVYSCVDFYRPKSVSADGNDWAVVKVDREINAPGIAIRQEASNEIDETDVVAIVGYPMGLPSKIADNGKVVYVDEQIFLARVDAYGGNSGSAILNSELLQRGVLMAEGVLAKGAADFCRTQPCKVSKKCQDEDNGCVGEKVTHSRKLHEGIQKLLSEYHRSK
ncbi:MAG: serine protease [Pseudomonadota bacterium]